MRLQEYPLFELRARTSSKSRYILRIEDSIPVPLDGSKLKLIKQPLVTLKNVRLSHISTEKRQLAYELYLRKSGSLPKILDSTWYVLAFYGTRVSSNSILYQDSNVRLVRGGNGNCLALIVRRTPKEDVEAAEISDEKGT